MEKASDKDPIRLNRLIAMLGAGARRTCDQMISEGRVTVDGRRVTDPSTRVVPGVSKVSVDGRPLSSQGSPLVLILNKPAGVVSTVTDPYGRPTVLELCRKYTRRRRLFPVGRLDVNTTGLILLTNDGMLCYRLTHPRYQIPRTYHVRVRGTMNDRKLVELDKLAAPRQRSRKRTKASVQLVRQMNRETILQITLKEGRNRQVRKMCESMGLRVVKLRRIRFGPLSVRNLPLGAVRPLEHKELERLNRVLQRGSDERGS
ncbi:MAG: pseudouridine synthase [Candidatus Krumholzibacteriia bacterium]